MQEGEQEYNLSFSIEGEWNNINIILGAEILSVEIPKGEQSIITSIPKKYDVSSVHINLADRVGNSSSIDISEYFVREEEKEESKKSIIPLIGLSVKDGISIGVVLFVFILLMIEVFVLARKGQLKTASGELFTIGAWWLVISVAIFNGFSGIIT